MRLRVIKVFLSAALALLPAVTPIFGAEYSAEMVVTGPGGTYLSSIFVKGDWQRHEQSGQIVIFNTSTGKTYTVMEEEKAYMEMGDDQGEGEDFPGDIEIGQAMEDDRGKTERLPSETFLGYTCHRYRHTPLEDHFGESDMWYSPDLKAAIKVVSQTPMGKVTMEYRNIQEGPQEGELFSVPEGYQRIELEF